MREGTNTEMTLESAFQVLIKGKEIKKKKRKERGPPKHFKKLT